MYNKYALVKKGRSALEARLSRPRYAEGILEIESKRRRAAGYSNENDKGIYKEVKRIHWGNYSEIPNSSKDNIKAKSENAGAVVINSYQ
jgi:hypothetical protein